VVSGQVAGLDVQIIGERLARVDEGAQYDPRFQAEPGKGLPQFGECLQGGAWGESVFDHGRTGDGGGVDVHAVGAQLAHQQAVDLDGGIEFQVDLGLGGVDRKSV